MTRSPETDYRDERAQLREQIKNADSETERREAILRLAEIDREIHADTYEKLARE
ncbi:hypothetical protein [Halococcus agarilyticus]|uniref:hypothetical protein n=1 Tax=Halococcus agarilyticus TaxID=1232219 RepID=UPI000ABF39B0|nr:hypothetical protein [Halococcus agarilyticus]